MTQGTFGVTLIRDGPVTAWGFRLHGGKDLGLPLTIQRVSLGSPAEGELRVGDILVSISGKDASKLSHHAATELIRKAGSELKLQILRPSGSLYRAPPAISASADPSLLRPLPTTTFRDTRPLLPGGPYLTEEQYEYLVDKEKEKIAVTTQPFRSTPLILPQGKPRHDLPVGSYLRHEQNRTRAALGDRINETILKTKLQEAAGIGHGSVSSRTSTPDSTSGPRLVHKQYNSPIQIYSPQAVVETMNMPPLPLRETVREMILNAASSISSGRSSNPTSPLPRSLPTSPLKLYSMTELERSPTYQVIHDEEWAALKRGELKEHEPVSSTVHSVQGGDVPRPRGDLAQSLTFKNLMHNLYYTKPGGDL